MDEVVDEVGAARCERFAIVERSFGAVLDWKIVESLS